MHLERAREIVRLLADGFDPYTGQALPPASPYQNADTVRALFLALDALESQARRQARKDRLPSQASLAWTPDEEARLVQEFQKGTPVRDLARLHGRTRGGIVARLSKLGLVKVTEPSTPDSSPLVEMASQGMRLEEIATRLGVKPDAAAHRLASFIERERGPLDELVSPEDRDAISDALTRLGGHHLKPVFEHFGGRYDYPTLKLARAWWKREYGSQEAQRR
ncbi:MAG: helix-turn-helix domain-containing protein [Candidatus Eremiobacterota bacterium]